jgi:hypothetical protein
MIRLARRASLLVALYLLTSVATANAECAWILWESETLQPKGKEVWTVVAAFSPKDGAKSRATKCPTTYPSGTRAGW